MLVPGFAGCSAQPKPVEQVATRSGSEALTQLTHQIGRLTTSGNSDRRTTINYDALGRVTGSRHAFEGAAYVYTNQYGYPNRALGPSDTAHGTVLRSTRLPDGEVVGYEYDSSGGQQKVSAGSDVILRRVLRNARGQTTTVEYGDGVRNERRYDDSGNLRLRQSVSTHLPSGRVLQAYEYDLDPVGNVKQIRDYCDPDTDQCPCDPRTGASCLPDRMSRAFDYDEMNRLVQVRAPDGMSITGLPRSYAYDATDNLTLKDGVPQTYGARGKPHALASAKGVDYSYDANGNLVSTSAGLNLAWNAQNMPVRTVLDGHEVRKDFVGEAVWKKVEGDVTTYYLPGIRIENGSMRKYYGRFAERDPNSAGALRFHHSDHLGSTTLVTNASGDVAHRAAYLPYGETDPDSKRQYEFTPKYRFNFKELETTTGLYDYGARMYNPETGTWISADGATNDGLNRYAYVRNNPVTLIDPTGHDSQDFVEKDDGYLIRTREGFFSSLWHGVKSIFSSKPPPPPGVHEMRASTWRERISDGWSEFEMDMGFTRNDYGYVTGAGSCSVTGYQALTVLAIVASFGAAAPEVPPPRIEPVTARLIEQRGWTPETTFTRWTKEEFVDVTEGRLMTHPNDTTGYIEPVPMMAHNGAIYEGAMGFEARTLGNTINAIEGSAGAYGQPGRVLVRFTLEDVLREGGVIRVGYKSQGAGEVFVGNLGPTFPVTILRVWE